MTVLEQFAAGRKELLIRGDSLLVQNLDLQRGYPSPVSVALHCRPTFTVSTVSLLPTVSVIFFPFSMFTKISNSPDAEGGGAGPGSTAGDLTSGLSDARSTAGGSREGGTTPTVAAEGDVTAVTAEETIAAAADGGIAGRGATASTGAGIEAEGAASPAGADAEARAAVLPMRAGVERRVTAGGAETEAAVVPEGGDGASMLETDAAAANTTAGGLLFLSVAPRFVSRVRRRVDPSLIL